ncbi:MAG: hypothetical protein QGM50_02750 [Anaerolineae bacterium]|nr:hypothetical protein [Anaerolineae bacterium]MDK1080692.1 hypothetical protein [Anaerolineae bacterium]MDK1117689.1 hypothetical protein [Anaerolineae bacterium]
MVIIKNEKLIKRNSKIGLYTNFGALAVLGIGMYISFTRPEYFVWAMAALLGGFTLTQIGMYFGNRWGRSPRPDERLDTGLKGLPKEFHLYHWTTPVSHLLVGPSGIWVLLPYNQRGSITYQKNRWKIIGGGFLQGYMRIFGQEGLGRPDLEAESQINAIRKALTKKWGDSEIPEIKAALVFTNPSLSFDVKDAPLSALPLKKLKDFTRQSAKKKPITTQMVEKVQAVWSK